jgi:poly-gamma-glutamate synthesis protein (capsule biosynthesis protein)
MEHPNRLDPASLIALILIPLYVVIVMFLHMLTPPPVVTAVDAAELVFVGDMMFDRYIRERAEISGYTSVLAKTKTLYSDADLLIGNLEGPITSFEPVADWRRGGAQHYTFTFATTVATSLAQDGFDAVLLSNNHTLDFGTDGANQTLELLAEAGIGYAGAPQAVYTPWRSTLNGVPVALFAYSTRFTDDTDELVGRIRGVPADTFVVVYAHWGDEYESIPNRGQRDLARRFIDAGAHLVVGAHPHVVQSKEQYNGAWIYYSLGNYVFDQYFSDAVRCGLVLSVDVAPDLTYTTSESFVELARDGTTVPSTCMDTVPVL